MTQENRTVAGSCYTADRLGERITHTDGRVVWISMFAAGWNMENPPPDVVAFKAAWHFCDECWFLFDPEDA